MAKRPDLEKLTPEQVWGMHLSGSSVQASELSWAVLNTISLADQYDIPASNRHGEFSRIAQQTSMAVFKRAESWQLARPYLLRAGKVVSNHYPVGEAPIEATLRGRLWEPVYGEESAQRICAQDMLIMYSALNQLVETPTLHSISIGLQAVLSNKLTMESAEYERFDLIHTIRDDKRYDVAKFAYTDFLRKYGFDSETKSIDQIITVSTVMFGRALDTVDTQTIGKCLQTLLLAFGKTPGQGKFILAELKKNFSQSSKNAVLRAKLERWSAAAREDADVLQVIKNLERLTYLGLGNGQVARLTQPS